MLKAAPEKRLQMTAKLAWQIYDAERELMEVLREAPEFKELELEREKRRYDRQGEYIKQMAQSLNPETTLQEARDTLWALTGRDLYRMLVIERGWSADEYEQWLARLLTQSIL